jgi:hypothetical protein
MVEIITEDVKTIGRVASVAVQDGKILFQLQRGLELRLVTCKEDNYVITILDNGDTSGGHGTDVFADI